MLHAVAENTGRKNRHLGTIAELCRVYLRN